MPGLAGDPGRYHLLGELARGGMGVIFKGRDVDLGRDLAVKVIHEEHRDHPEMIRRFVEEAQIGGQLQHPGIVPVHEIGRFADGRLCIAMKLIKGCTLAALLEDRKEPAADRPRFLSIKSAVRTLRSGSGSDESRAGSVLGTPAYMASEQARGALDTVDERADVLGLGSILCEILTGLPAYAGHSTAELYRMAERADLGDALVRLDSCGASVRLVALAQSSRLRNASDAGESTRAWPVCAMSRRWPLLPRPKDIRSEAFGPGSRPSRSRLAAVSPRVPHSVHPPEYRRTPIFVTCRNSAERHGRTPRLFTNEKSLQSVAFSGDGRMLATGGADGCVRIWDVALARARPNAPRTGRIASGTAVAQPVELRRSASRRPVPSSARTS
ncbi:MAG TPA: protein kinase [Isosphaeraceae bacterium]|nr:protein kinase [Isosphaeraceae bacterium]